MRVIVTLLMLLCASCANDHHDECGDQFLLLWPTGDNEFSFQKIQLSTLNSPYELRGGAAVVYVESRITDTGYEGKPARPNLTRSEGGLCVPMDVKSSMALSAYAQFERLKSFDQDLRVDHFVSWPRSVGVEIHMRSGENSTHNNAHYFAKGDGVAVIPYSANGLPMGLNPGVLSHEHFHAHFQSQVVNAVNVAISSVASLENFFYAGIFGVKPEVEDLDSDPLQTTASFNKFVLRSWNEGLADFYASVFTARSEFFSNSLPKVAPERDLAGPLHLMKTGEQLAAEYGGPPHGIESPAARQLRRQNLITASYSQGTLLARMLYRLSRGGARSSRDLLVQLMTRLQRIPALVAPEFNSKVMDFDQVVPTLLEGLQLSAHDCGVLNMAVGKSTMRSFPQCGL